MNEDLGLPTPEERLLRRALGARRRTTLPCPLCSMPKTRRNERQRLQAAERNPDLLCSRHKGIPENLREAAAWNEAMRRLRVGMDKVTMSRDEQTQAVASIRKWMASQGWKVNCRKVSSPVGYFCEISAKKGVDRLPVGLYDVLVEATPDAELWPRLSRALISEATYSNLKLEDGNGQEVQEG